MRLTIEGKPPVSLNKQLRMHWATRNRYSKSWYKAVWAAFNAMPVEVQNKYPLRRCQIRFEASYSGGPILDEDNALGAYKPVVDGLVRAGVLEDDTMEHISQRTLFQQRTKKGRERLEIVIAPA